MPRFLTIPAGLAEVLEKDSVVSVTEVIGQDENDVWLWGCVEASDDTCEDEKDLPDAHEESLIK